MPVVYTAANPVEAHLCRQYLESHGIRALVAGEILWMSRGEFPLNEATQPQVSVSETDHQRAVELMEKFHQQLDEPESGESWTCRNCGEQCPAHYQICWNCQTAAEPS